jgi:hypothetical protein
MVIGGGNSLGVKVYHVIEHCMKSPVRTDLLSAALAATAIDHSCRCICSPFAYSTTYCLFQRPHRKSEPYLRVVPQERFRLTAKRAGQALRS